MFKQESVHEVIDGIHIAPSRLTSFLGSTPAKAWLKTKVPERSERDLDSKAKVQFGLNGEVFVLLDKHLYIWDWVPAEYGDADLRDGQLYNIYKSQKLDIKHFHFADSLRGLRRYSYWYSLDAEPKTLTEFAAVSGGILYSHPEVADYRVETFGAVLSVFKQLKKVSSFSCKSVHDKLVYSHMGEWLAFCPEEDDDLMLDIADGKIPLSPVKVDGKRTLLNKFMKSLSATAIDSAVKLVEVSQTSQRKADFRNSKQDISKGNQKSYLVLLNLESMKPIMAFPVPGGCSHVSLSPYDMALTTTTMRGDEILMWDFSSFKSNVILVDRFKRGKTAGIIDQVVWASGNKSIGVLSRTGSIHWFVHLLNESSPNRKSWMIPGTGARTIGLAPKFEGEYGVNPRAAAGTVNSAPRVDRYGMMPDVAITDPTVKVETHQTNQYEYRVKTGESRLLVYCEDDTVKTIDTRTGEWEFTLPLLNARIMEQKCNIVFDFPSAVDLNRKRYAASRGTPQFGFDTLSQAEIDISPKSGAGTKLHIEFSTYAFDSNEENSRESFIRRLETMTCTSDAQPVNFGKASGVPIFSGTAPSIDPCDSGVLNLKTAIETDLKLS